MRYMKITPSDTVNGDGLRVVLWLAGCNHHCKGCHNPESWDYCNGKEFTEIEEEKIFKILSDKFISGITFTGGDPLYEENRKDLYNLILKIKDKFPEKNIWLWTGYTMSEIMKNSEMQKIVLNVNMVIDGRFVQELSEKDKYRGSKNQRRYKIENYTPVMID